MNAISRLGHSNILEYVRETGTALIDFIPVSSAAIITLDDSLKPFACHSLKQTPLFQLHGYMNDYWRHDPLLPNPDDGSSRIRCWSSQRSTHPSAITAEVYNNFLKNESCSESLRIDLKIGERVVGCLALGRQASQGSFTSKEIELLYRCLKLLDLSEKINNPQSIQSNSDKLENFSFTPREIDILQLLKEGESNKEIAIHLGIGLPTIKSHLINIFKKAGVNSRTGLLAAVYLWAPLKPSLNCTV